MTVIKKKRKLKKSVKITSGAIIGVIALFSIITFYYHNKWYPNTSINGIDVSSMTYEESKKVLKEEIENYSLEIMGQDNQKMVINGKDIDLTVDYEKALKKDYQEHQSSRNIFGILGGHSHDINLVVSYNQDRLNQMLNDSVLIKGNEEYKIIQSTSAHVEYDESTKSGKLVAATVGNELNIDKFNELIIESIKKITNKIDLTDQEKSAEIYNQPVKNLSDGQLDKMLQTYNNYLLNWITWDMGENKTETMSPDDIKNWLSCNNQGEVVLDRDAMNNWIEEFCLRYKTVGKARNFTTHTGNVIQVSGGDYGWRLDYEKIIEQVYATITETTEDKLIEAYISNQNKKNQKALTTQLEPTYSNKGHQKDYVNFENDWDTQNYSEVDLTEQKIYVYRDGQLAYTAICVTGLPTEKQDRITRTGVWYIKEKKPDKVLVGEDYKTPVKYWIRIMWTGTGYHALDRSDWANWTPELYKTKGSHGCINLQENDAKSIYDIINMNDPVFIHW